ncbi:MAG: YcnI family protein, partial [Gaiellaceae bacterium]
MFIRAFLSAVAAALLFTSAAAAHVTLNPNEWEAGGFARFAVRVPNERDKADTIEVTVRFPQSIISASFQPKPGWKRSIEMEPLDEPVEEEGEQITEHIASVTWSGGKIAPGEFEEFGVSFRVPETPGEDLVFPAIQTYSNGEVVRWIGPPDSESPAPTVAVLPPEEEEGGGQTGATTTATTTEAEPTAASGAANEDDNGLAIVALIVGIAALLAGLGALALAWARS